MPGEPVCEGHHDGKNHGSRAHYGGADQHRLCRSLESVAGAVILFQQMLGAVKIQVKAVLSFTSAATLGTCSINDSSYTDCALSVTGP